MPHIKSRFEVQSFKEWVNLMLKRSDKETTDDYKKGLCEALEHVLKECNCYNGFDYTYWKETGYMEWMKAGQPEGEGKEKFIFGPSGQQYNRMYS